MNLLSPIPHAEAPGLALDNTAGPLTGAWLLRRIPGLQPALTPLSDAPGLIFCAVAGTLPSRFLILALTESFYGREDHGLLERFVPELPGILLWAQEGWERLYRRGRFVQPDSSLELINQLEDLGSPIGAFVRDRQRSNSKSIKGSQKGSNLPPASREGSRSESVIAYYYHI